jgi:outer membrane biosynthesis protein TonB
VRAELKLPAATLLITLQLQVGFSDDSLWQIDRREPIQYPLIAAQARVEGSVEETVEIRTDGTVIRSESHSGHPLLASHAKENAARWRFRKTLNEADALPGGKLVYIFRLTGPCETSLCATATRFEPPNRVIVETKAPHWIE